MVNFLFELETDAMIPQWGRKGHHTDATPTALASNNIVAQYYH